MNAIVRNREMVLTVSLVRVQMRHDGKTVLNMFLLSFRNGV